MNKQLYYSVSFILFFIFNISNLSAQEEKKQEIKKDQPQIREGFNLHDQEKKKPPFKLNLRLLFATFNNSLLSNSSTHFGSFDAALHYFFTPRFSSGLGLDFHYTFSGEANFIGFRNINRYYFSGSGFPLRTDTPVFEKRSLSRWGFYTGGEFKYYRYFVPEKTQEEITDAEINRDSFKGSFFAIDLLIGLDYRFSSRWEVNGELAYSLLEFASSDILFKYKAMILGFGVGYNF